MKVTSRTVLFSLGILATCGDRLPCRAQELFHFEGFVESLGPEFGPGVPELLDGRYRVGQTISGYFVYPPSGDDLSPGLPSGVFPGIPLSFSIFDDITVNKFSTQPVNPGGVTHAYSFAPLPEGDECFLCEEDFVQYLRFGPGGAFLGSPDADLQVSSTHPTPHAIDDQHASLDLYYRIDSLPQDPGALPPASQLENPLLVGTLTVQIYLPAEPDLDCWPDCDPTYFPVERYIVGSIISVTAVPEPDYTILSGLLLALPLWKLRSVWTSRTRSSPGTPRP